MWKVPQGEQDFWGSSSSSVAAVAFDAIEAARKSGEINAFDHKVKELGVIKLVFVVLHFPFCFMEHVFVTESSQESRISSVVRTYSRSWIGTWIPRRTRW